MRERVRFAAPKILIAMASSLTMVTGTAIADDTRKARVGTCDEAKSQSKYWCEERAKVTVISFGMECENAKKNVLEACEGKKSTDTPYKFPDGTKKK